MLQQALRAFDIPRLGRFVAAGKHHDKDISPAREVETITSPYIHAHLGPISADRLPIAKIASLGQTQARRDANLSAQVSETIKPILKRFCLLNSEHMPIVS